MGITILSMIDANFAEEIFLKTLPIGLKIPENAIAITCHPKRLRAFKPPKRRTIPVMIAVGTTQLGKLRVNAPVAGERPAWLGLPPAVGLVAPVAGSRAGVPEPHETDAPPPGRGMKTVP